MWLSLSLDQAASWPPNADGMMGHQKENRARRHPPGQIADLAAGLWLPENVPSNLVAPGWQRPQIMTGHKFSS